LGKPLKNSGKQHPVGQSLSVNCRINHFALDAITTRYGALFARPGRNLPRPILPAQALITYDDFVAIKSQTATHLQIR
jgi:hypothetical protein